MSTITCTRRPHAVWTNCECPDCKARNSRVRKEREAGRWHTIPKDVVWASLDRVLEVLTPAEVTKALGVTSDVIRSAMRKREATGYQRRFTHHVAAGIVALARDLDHVQPKFVPAVGSARRLQALATMGWSLKAISEQLGGVSAGTLGSIRIHDTQVIGYDLARRIAKVYDDLWDQRREGPAGTQTRKAAAEFGWAVPLAWDDDEIDDPDAQPWSEESEWPDCQRCKGTGWRDGHKCWSCNGLGRRRYAPSSPKRADVDDIAWLAEAGGTFDSIALRLGVEPSSLNTRLARAGRTDLLLTITANANTNHNSDHAIHYYAQRRPS